MAGVGAPKGRPKPAGSGRQKGSKDIPRKKLDELLRAKYGRDYNPIVELAAIAHDLEGDKEYLGERIQCLTAVGKWLLPQLKAIEHRGEVTVRQSLDLSDPAVVQASRSIGDQIGLH